MKGKRRKESGWKVRVTNESVPRYERLVVE